MIERKFVASNIKEFMIQEFINSSIRGAEISHTRLQRTPLGEKIVIYSSRPGLIVGRKGQNIKQLTKVLKKKFNLENPQIEISEVENLNIDARIMAEKIANYLEKFGTTKFKSIGHKVMTDVMKAGAMGIEIVVSGKIPSSRAKSWRFYQGYLKKCGDIALTGVNVAHTVAQLKTGIVGIKVSIMPPNTKLPDDISIKTIEGPSAEVSKESSKPQTKESEEKPAETSPKSEEKKKKRAPRKKKESTENKEEKEQ